jgi:hypothetical protein
VVELLRVYLIKPLSTIALIAIVAALILRHNHPLPEYVYLLELIAIVASPIFTGIQRIVAIGQHPRVNGQKVVELRDVPSPVIEEWRRLNPQL